MSQDVKPASLSRTAARGARTVMVGQIGRMALQLASVTILSRLLSPQDYGLLAMALAVVALGEVFRDFGLSTAAIQAPTLSRHQRDKLFWLNVAIGAGLTVLCICLSPVAALVFDQKALQPVLAALSVVFVLNGATAQYRADLNRRLRFGAIVLSDVVGQVVGITLAVVLAVNGAGALALVAQQLATGLVTLVVAAVLAGWIPGRPRRGVDTRAITRFGVGLVASQIVGYLSSNVDTLVIGIRFSVADLGYYNRGYQLLMRPLNQLRAPTTTVALPVLQRLRQDLDRSSDFLVKGQLALGYTIVPMLAVAAGTAGPLIEVFLGPSWSAVAPIFALLAVAGAFQTLSYVGSWVYLSRALTGKLFWYSLISLAIKVIAVLVGSQWGVLGVAVGMAVAPALSWPISIWWLSRLTPMPIRRLNIGAARIILAAGLAGGGSLTLVQLVPQWPSWLLVLAGVGVTALVYALLAVVFRRVRTDLLEVVALMKQAVAR